MKRAIMALVVTALLAGAAQADNRSVLGDILKGVTGTQSSATAGALTQRDAAAGLREALQMAAVTVATRLGRPDGFFADPRVRIPLPGALGRAQSSLAPLGLSAPLDDLQRRVNRGAEAAMPQARTLFVNAIKSMTIADGVAIVRGGEDAGTRFLRDRTQAQLATALRPHMETALHQAGAFTALDAAAARAGAAGGAASLRNDLIQFAVGKALDGAFGYIAEEERAIRNDPARRTTAILRKVFGA
ncbi:MAG: DUF4197 domain-containing protein [Hyphomonadaceae bacterium]|nr:DUF4197 domain-containing protein [Hyphomonadaceae bacterium]